MQYLQAFVGIVLILAPFLLSGRSRPVKPTGYKIEDMFERRSAKR